MEVPVEWRCQSDGGASRLEVPFEWRCLHKIVGDCLYNYEPGSITETHKSIILYIIQRHLQVQSDPRPPDASCQHRKRSLQDER